MNTTKTDINIDFNSDKEFWDDLLTELLETNKTLSNEDVLTSLEKSIMFSMFFRGSSHKELNVYKRILNFKNSGYVIIFEFLAEENTDFDNNIDELTIYNIVKSELKGFSTAVGPMIDNRFCVLITDDPEALASATDNKSNSLTIASSLLKAIENKLQTKLIAGIGNVQSLHSIFTSFLEALSCMHTSNPSEVLHVDDIRRDEKHYFYDYKEAEQHMIEAIQLKKSDAYDYFLIMMNQISQLNDNTKRNKIIEALVLSSHASNMNSNIEVGYYDYTSHIKSLMTLNGHELIEWAFQKFIDITGQVKKYNAIDYSNKIVQATREYLEANYMEEISLDDAAQHVNISPQYFSKLIKKNTGFNFIEWLSILRINKAKDLLTNSSHTVKEVCFMVGYKDPNYFSRIFRKKIGMTPTEYVKKVKSI